jgi:hypothetical protein
LSGGPFFEDDFVLVVAAQVSLTQRIVLYGLSPLVLIGFRAEIGAAG